MIWLAQHGVAVGALALAGLPVYVKFCGYLLICAGMYRARPRPGRTLRVSRDGDWALPDEALSGLQILPATQFTQCWILIELGAAGGVRRSWCIWFDTLSPHDWRQLIIQLREQRRRGC